MGYETVLLDLDDTLYPYGPCNEAGKRAAHERFRDLGYDCTREEFEGLYRAARRETKREIPTRAASHERYLYFKQALRLHADVHDAAAALSLGEAFWSAYKERMEPRDGVVDTLEGLRAAGLDVVVVSDLTTRIQLEKLVALGVDDLVDDLVTSEETGREKPSAVMFTRPLARLDTRPSEAVMVGDSVERDVVGANAVGVETVLFDAGGAAGDGPEAGTADGEAPGQHDDQSGDQHDDRYPDHRQPDHRVEVFPAVAEVVL